MGTVSTSLPDPLRDWVEAQIKTGQYANNSNCLRDLIRKDQRNSEKLKTLQEAITQDFASDKAGKLDMQAVKKKTYKNTANLLTDVKRKKVLQDYHIALNHAYSRSCLRCHSH